MVHTRDLRHEPWRYRLRAFVSKPANLLLVFFLIVLVLLSLLPMATMLSNMFTVHVGTEKKLLRLPVGSATLWQPHKSTHRTAHSSAAHTPLCIRPPGRGFILVRFSISPTTRLF